MIEAMHPGLKYITLDEVAECFPCVSPELSRVLWGLMPKDDEIPPQGEWPEPDSADRKVRFVSRFWDAEGAFTDEQRAAINAAATAREKEWA